MPTQKPAMPPPVVVVRKKRSSAAPVSEPSRPKAAPPVAPPPAPPPRPPQPSPAPVSAVPPAPPPVAASPPADPLLVRQQRHQARTELLALLRERWPQTFPADHRLVKPFALGLHQEIHRALPEVKGVLLRRTIYYYQCGGKGAYWRAILRGGPRYALDGTPSGEVTAEDQAHAKARLAEVRAWWAANRARRPRGVPPADAPQAQTDPPTEEVSEPDGAGASASSSTARPEE